MLELHLSKCAPEAWFHGTTSLNVPVGTGESEQGYSELIELIRDPRANVEDELISISKSDCIHQFILKLPKRLRDIAYLKYWLDFPQNQIAAKLNISSSTVSRALQEINILGKTQLMLN